jgi:pimeloyl-ACP methyl ester carboxylesterase
MLLAYDDDGPGPVVVLLHGFPLNRSMWSAQETSVGSIYRVIAPDLRGHGESAAPEGVYTIDGMADDVIELLDALQLREPVVLGGLSMGGYVALSLIVRYPERFRALMLMDTRATADSPDAARNREDLARKVEASGNAGHVVEAMWPKMVSDATRRRRAELLGPLREAMEKTPARSIVGALRGMAARPDRTADLATIGVPTLVLVGADDAITPVDEVRAMAEKIPGARFVVVPDAGHLAPLENPEVADRAILDFLAGLPDPLSRASIREAES